MSCAFPLFLTQIPPLLHCIQIDPLDPSPLEINIIVAEIPTIVDEVIVGVNVPMNARMVVVFHNLQTAETMIDMHSEVVEVRALHAFVVVAQITKLMHVVPQMKRPINTMPSLLFKLVIMLRTHGFQI